MKIKASSALVIETFGSQALSDLQTPGAEGLRVGLRVALDC